MYATNRSDFTYLPPVSIDFGCYAKLYARAAEFNEIEFWLFIAS
jgi:hypothetical protein